MQSLSILLGSSEWPAESFGDIPEPNTEAAIIKVDTIDGGATVEYQGMKESELAAYVDVVKSLGYTEKADETRSQSYYSYTALRNSEGHILDMVIISYEISDGGIATTRIGCVRG